MSLEVRVRAGGREVTVLRAHDGTLSVDEAGFSATALGASTWHVTGPEGASVAHVVADADGWWVHAEGDVHRIERTDHEAGATRQAARHRSEHALTAPMPAMVLVVHVSPGQRVEAGDTLLVIEAMKMELPVRAPRGGTVTAVHCRPGEMVQPGVTLVDLA
jgi:biotin carboxyl carrier protein